MNDDINQDIERAKEYLNQNRLSELHILLKNLLKNDPQNYVILSLIGQMEHKKGQFDAALVYFNQAQKISPHNISIIANMGSCFAAKRHYSPAEICFKQALSLQADHIFSLIELAIVYIKQHRYKEAQKLAQKALALSNDDPQVIFKSAQIYQESGNIEKATEYFYEAYAAAPHNLQYLKNLAANLFYLRKLDNIIEIFSSTTNAIQKTPAYANAYIYNIFSHYVQNSPETAAIMREAHHLFQQPDTALPYIEQKDYKISCIFFSYINDLLEKKQNTPACENTTSLYLMGDSHTLSFAHQELQWHSIKYISIPYLIAGVKAYHLSTAPNKFTDAFSRNLANLPNNSNIVIMVGEIDCRTDEGIIRHHKKHPEENLQQSIATLVERYVSFISECNATKQHTLYFWGVPAPSTMVLALSNDEDIALHRSIVEIFNTSLKESVAKHGYIFFDIYGYTTTDKGYASSGQHIDSHHLNPSIFQQVLNSTNL